MLVIAVKLWNLGYIMTKIARDVIDPLKHTTSILICWMLSACCSKWRIEVYLLGYMDDAYLSFIDISCDVLLKDYLLDILVHAFGILMGYILGHVVGELMR
jgi:hypothetical protein